VQGWRTFRGASLTLPADAAASATAAGTTARSAMSTGPVNIGFAQDMSLHHEQALYMARLALTRGTPRVHALAEGIVNQKLKEIGYMQGWLLLWDAPAAAETDDMRWMKDAYVAARKRDPVYEQFIESCTTGQGMPGLAKPAELEHLATLEGDAFDGQFLALMIRHHQGAMVMSRFTSEHAESEAVTGFARSIAAEQRREMGQMMGLLNALQRSGG
jgi:uncharacterized protein (DUF305 family)